MTLDKIKRFVNWLLATGQLPDQSRREFSKPINFYLDCQSLQREGIDNLIASIVKEVEAYEQTNRIRKNKRAIAVHKRFSNSIRLLILNALHARALTREGVYLGIGLNKNVYGLNKRYAPPFITYDPLYEAYNGLRLLGYIALYREGFFDGILGHGQTTRIAATDKLIKSFHEHSPSISFVKSNAEEETILLRDSDKRLTEYTDTDFTNTARERLKAINAVLTRHQYALPLTEAEQQELHDKVVWHHDKDESGESVPFIDYTSVKLFRIFSDESFKRGGRFYRGWWQNVPKHFRPKITIDAKPTVEIDYSTFHPSILYALQGLPLDFDAYDVHSDKVNRDTRKAAFNALLNAKRTTKKPDDFWEGLTGISWKDFLGAIRAKNQPVAHLFMTGIGLDMQFHDSELAESILLHFTSKDIPCLPIHDSFIISAEYADELDSIMKEYYQARFKQSIKTKRIPKLL